MISVVGIQNECGGGKWECWEFQELRRIDFSPFIRITPNHPTMHLLDIRLYPSPLTSLVFDQKDDTLRSIWDDVLPIKGRSLWQVKDDTGDKTWWQFIFSIKGAVNWINFVWLAIKLTPFFFLQLSGFTPNAQVLYPRHKHLLLIKEMLNVKQNLNLLSGFASGSLDTCQNVSIPNFTKRPSKVVIIYITREATLAHAKALLIFYNVRRLNRASSFKPGLSLAHLQGFKLHENMTFLTPLSWSY